MESYTRVRFSFSSKLVIVEKKRTGEILAAKIVSG